MGSGWSLTGTAPWGVDQAPHGSLGPVGVEAPFSVGAVVSLVSWSGQPAT